MLTKRVLIDLSHAIEQFALAAEPAEPLVVIALFQKASYFQRELEVYRSIARRAAVTLVALAEDRAPELPDGVAAQLLGRDDPLTREWSVTVLGPHGGATLVAIDQETIAGEAPTVEQGRLFLGHWSFRRDDAFGEIVRLRSQLRPAPSTVAAIDDVLGVVAARPEPRHQEQWDGPLRFLAARVELAVRGRDRARNELQFAQAGSKERDPRTGLLTPAYLHRWTAGLGDGTLPIGLVALRVLDVQSLRERFGARAEMGALVVVAGILTDLATDTDRVIRVGRESFLFVLPGWSHDQVVDLIRRITARTARLEEQYPFVPLGTAVAATVTRSRPLPVDRLFDELEHRRPDDGAPRLLAG